MKHLLRILAALLILPTLSLAQGDVARPVIPVPAAPTQSAPGANAPPILSPVQNPAPASDPATPSPSGLPPLPSSAPTFPANAPQVSATYVIGPEDAISVNVWKEPTVSGAFAVRPDGMISLPLLGDITASGLTPMTLGTDIATRLKKYLTDPLVTVTVTAVNSKRYYMVGEVSHTGPLPLAPGMTPMQAIAAAGGLSVYANPKKIYILRTDKGKQVKIPFNYKKAIKDGDQQGVTLLSGDTIVVP